MLSRGMLPMKQEIISLSFSYSLLFFGWLFCQKLARSETPKLRVAVVELPTVAWLAQDVPTDDSAS